MTERDHTDPDEARRRTAGEDRAGTERISGPDAGDGGRTRVITTADRGASIPPQAGPPPAGGYGTPTNYGPPPANPTRGYGPGDAFGPPTTAAPAAGPGYAAGGGYGGGYGQVGYPPGGYGAPGQAGPAYGGAQPYGAPGYGSAQPYGGAQQYGGAQPYGAAPTYGAAPSYGPPTTAGYPPSGYGDPNAPYGSSPPPGYTPTATGGGRKKTTLVIALAAVVALLAGGIGAYFWFFRGGGAATPVEASRLMADDLQSGDLGRAVSRLHPDEVALAGDVGGMFRDELVRLDVLRSDIDDDTLISGTTFADLRFDDAAVEQVRPNVAITKLVAGTITVNRDVNTLPLTDNYKKLAYPNGAPPAEAPEVIDIAQVVADQGRPVRVATVQVDGDWYVSLTYSLADAALVDEGQAWPQTSIAPRGSATAQDAVRDGVTALFAQDAQRLVEMAAPHELAVIHDVGPLLVQNAGTSRSTVRLVDLATTPTEIDGGTALTIDRIVVAENGGQQITVVRDGDCLSVTQTGGYSGGAPTRVCAQDIANQGVGSLPNSTDPAIRDVMLRASRAVLGLKLVVVEDEGQYYVSPVRTVAGLGLDVLRTLQPADLARLAEAAQPR